MHQFWRNPFRRERETLQRQFQDVECGLKGSRALNHNLYLNLNPVPKNPVGRVFPQPVQPKEVVCSRSPIELPNRTSTHLIQK
jgi:hypothetical protein